LEVSTTRPVAAAMKGDAAHEKAEGHCAKLAELRDTAVEKGKLGAAVTAEHKRGLALGFYIERRADVAPEVRSSEQLKHALKQSWQRSQPSKRLRKRTEQPD
jgi:hypothetical protein